MFCEEYDIIDDVKGNAEDEKSGETYGGWNPKGGIIVKLELEKNLLDSLGKIAKRDGLNSVYQIIRNALYSYVKYRTGRFPAKRGKVRREIVKW